MAVNHFDKGLFKSTNYFAVVWCPIVAVNLNKKKVMDNNLCPPLLKDKLAIHIPFGHNALNYALNHWPSSHENYKKEGKTGAYTYKESVYESYGV